MAQKIAFFDLDGTFFRWQLYHELVFELKDRNVFSGDTALRLDTSLIAWQAKKQSWHDYEADIIHALEPALPNLDTALFDEAAHAVVARSGHKIYNYTKRLLATVKQEGYYTLAISGSPQEIAEPFAMQYGFDSCIGALYERQANTFTGMVARRVPGRKHEIIKEFLNEHQNITLKDSIAIGDSDGDIAMLRMAERPIAFNPSTILHEVATEHGWTIVLERKNIAYTLEKGNNGLYLLEKTDSF